MTSPRRSLAVSTVLVALVVSAVGCGSDGDDGENGPSPSEVLAEAKDKFDGAASVELALSTDSTPTSGDAVLGATGTLTQQPAFDGQVKVVISGFTADVPIVSVDGKVWAKLPLTPAFAPIDPAEYGAPDPADFVDPESGISTLLTKLADARAGKQVREGELVLTTYTGTLSGDLVQPIIPSADAKGSYDTAVGIDADGYIRTLEVTGEFFSGGGDETYDVALDDYDKPVTIKAP